MIKHSQIERKIKIDLEENNAFFLWGPRKTGKSTYLKTNFPDAWYIDMLQSDTETRYTINPQLLSERIKAEKPKLVIIDEVQKVPQILNEVHWCLENTDSKFILCGSSARKLKRGAANLLGGRAWRYELFPLSFFELDKLDIKRAINHGLLPQHYFSQNPDKFLQSYVLEYLNEEIKAESNIQNIARFNTFLEAVASHHGELINYANIARECGVSAKTVKEYYQILEDTLLGFRLAPWTHRKNKKLIETEKFYLFDIGLVKALKRLTLIEDGTPNFGNSFEHFIINEIRAYISYTERLNRIYFWRSNTGQEVDVIIENTPLAIEIKASHSVQKSAAKHLHVFMEDNPSFTNGIIISQDTEKREIKGGILIYPWQDFLSDLWAEKLF